MQDIFNTKAQYKEELIQNSLGTTAPEFCLTPHWYVNGLEKQVKIGRKSFNYMDYCEAWLNLNCYTYRSADTLDTIYRQILAAFREVKDYKILHNIPLNDDDLKL